MDKSAKQVVFYLQDAHGAELGISQMLREFLEEPIAGDQGRIVIEKYLDLTIRHIQKLEQRLDELGVEQRGGVGFFMALLSKIDEMMESVEDVHDRTTDHLIKCYAAQHFQQGMYSSLSCYAVAAGDLETESLADGFVAEVEDSALMFYPMIETCAQRP